MKKLLLMVLVLCMCTVVFTGCSSDDEAEETPVTAIQDNTPTKAVATPAVTDNTDVAVTPAVVNEVSAEDMKAAYQAFLNGEKTVKSSNSSISWLEANKEYNYTQMCEAYAKYLSEDFDESELIDSQYAYIDCGDDGVPELALNQIYSIYVDESNLISVIKYIDGQLYVVSSIGGFYRSFVDLNEYGYLTYGGSNGALEYYVEYRVINKDGEETFLYSETADGCMADAYISTYDFPTHSAPEGYPEDVYGDYEDSITCLKYNFTEYGADEDEYYKNNFFTFCDDEGKYVAPNDSLAQIYKDNGIAYYDVDTSNKMINDHVSSLGVTDKIKSGNTPEWISMMSTEVPEFRQLHIDVDTHRIEKYNDDGVTEAELEYFVASLSDEDAADFPKLNSTLYDMSSLYINGEDEIVADLAAGYEEECKLMDDVYQFYSSSKGTVLRADTRIVSILDFVTAYSGGLHYMYGYVGENIDPVTGRYLELSDVVKDTDKFFELVDERLLKQIEGKDMHLLSVTDFLADQGDTAYALPSFTVSHEGVTVYFDPYVLGSFADGAQIIEIYYDEAPEIFESKYFEECGDYIIPMNTDQVYWVDVDEDGIRDAISLEFSVTDDWGEYYHLVLHNGLGSMELEYNLFSYEAYLIRKNGKYFIWSLNCSDSDYTMLEIVNLEEMLIKNRDFFNWSCNMSADPSVGDDYKYEYGDNYYKFSNIRSSVTDVSSIWLSCLMNVFSTFSGKLEYSIDADGYPVANGSLATVDSCPLLKTKTALKCELVNESGSVTGKKEIPEGTVLRIVRSDGSSFADMTVYDSDNVIYFDDYIYSSTDEYPAVDYSGDVYRIYRTYDDKSYNYIVNDTGLSEYDVFSGILYAG